MARSTSSQLATDNGDRDSDAIYMVGNVQDNIMNDGSDLGCGTNRGVVVDGYSNDEGGENDTKTSKDGQCHEDQEEDDRRGQDVQLLLKKYVDETIVLPSPASQRRVDCCGSSRSLYCPECFNLLLPSDYWPWNDSDTDHHGIDNDNETKVQAPHQHERLPVPIKIPFSMDIILGRKERRTSSTGVHIMVLRRLMLMSVKMSMSKTEEETNDRPKQSGKVGPRRTSPATSSSDASSSALWCWKNTKLIDLNRFDCDGTTENCDDNFNSRNSSSSSDEDGDDHDYDDTETTYVLFPSSNSIPIGEVASKIKKLIVIDCKWSTTGGMKGMDVLAKVDGGKYSNFHERYQFVRLDSPPSHSLFWRWHHFDGHGMLSTIEAIYFAALEVHDARHRAARSKASRSNSTSFAAPEPAVDPAAPKDIAPLSIRAEARLTATTKTTTRESMIYVMWLFGLQRRLILHDRVRLEQQKTQKQQQNKPNEDNFVEDATLQSQLEETALPWSEEAKAYQIRLRHRKDGADFNARQKREIKKGNEITMKTNSNQCTNPRRKRDHDKKTHPSHEVER